MKALGMVGLIVAALLAATPSWGQRDRMQMGESLGGKVLRATPQPVEETFDVTIAPDAARGVRAALGGLTYTKLPPHIRAALGFLVRWGRGPSTVTTRANPDPQTPVIVTVAGTTQTYVLKDVQLRPPVAGLQAVRTDSGQLEAVAVAAIAVTTPAGPVQGRGVLALRQEADGWFTVTSVLVEGR